MGLTSLKTKSEKQTQNDARPEISVGHVGLRVKNLKDAFEFFKLVGGRGLMNGPGMAIVELRGGTHLVLRQDPNADPYAGFDLMVDDIEGLRDRLITAGYRPSPIGRGGIHSSFDVAGPSGLMLEFTSSHAMGRPV